MSFPRYDKYKDSGVEWLGEVPAHWAISRLGYESWVRARLGWKGLKAEEYVDDGFVLLATPNIKGKDIDFENVNYINEFRYEESPEIKLRAGDVLLAKDGSTLGTVNVVRELPRHGTVNSSIAVITPGVALRGSFLYYLLQSTYMANTIQRIKGGMGVPHLFQWDLNKFYLPLPPLPEQGDIATFLDHETAKIDALVEEQKRLIELLKEKRQAVISHAVTKGLNPNAPMKDSGVEWLGEVPAHWAVRPFKQCIAFQEGPGIMAADFREEGIPLLRIACVQGQLVTLDGCNYLDPVKVTRQWSHFRVEAADLLISGSASMGVVSEVGDEAAGSVPYTGLIRLQGRRGGMRKDFIKHLVVSDSFMRQVQRFKTGSTIQHFGPTHLNQMVVVCPPEEEQEAIAQFLVSESRRMDSLCREAEAGMALLQERRTALVSAAVTGKIDVRAKVEQPERALA